MIIEKIHSSKRKKAWKLSSKTCYSLLLQWSVVVDHFLKLLNCRNFTNFRSLSDGWEPGWWKKQWWLDQLCTIAPLLLLMPCSLVVFLSCNFLNHCLLFFTVYQQSPKGISRVVVVTNRSNDVLLAFLSSSLASQSRGIDITKFYKARFPS